MNRHLQVIVFLSLFLLLSGCGRKTPVIPPQAAVPAAVQDLTQQFDATGVTLSWTYPTFSESGEKIDYVKTFQLYRNEVEAEDYCPSCPVVYNSSTGFVASTGKPGSALSYRDTSLKPHHHYTYKIVCRSGWNIVSADSNLVSFRWESPPAAPVGFTIKAEGGSLSLGWQSVTSLVDGRTVSSPIRYQLFRRERGDFAPIGDPVAGLSYTDKGLSSERKYFYKVKALRSVDDIDMVSPPSEVISGTPLDKTAPQPPSKLSVVLTGEGAKLLWEDAGEYGVIGYRVYRRLSAEEKYILIGETGRRSFSYVDKNMPDGKTIYYTLTAIDNASPPNESKYAGEVEVRR